MVVGLTPEEELELRKSIDEAEPSEDEVSEDLGSWISVKEILDKANEVIKVNPALTLGDIRIESDYYYSYEDIETSLTLDYIIDMSNEKAFDLAKSCLIDRKRRDFEAYQRALEVVKGYENK